jgi:hypothetical protein
MQEKARDVSRESNTLGTWHANLVGRSLSPPGNAHGGHAAEVHCGGLAEGIITMTGAVMMDKTGWSIPIGATRQTE